MTTDERTPSTLSALPSRIQIDGKQAFDAIYYNLPYHQQEQILEDYPESVIYQAIGGWMTGLDEYFDDREVACETIKRHLFYPNLALLSPVVSHDAFGWAVWLSMKQRELSRAPKRELDEFLRNPIAGLQKTVDIAVVTWAAQSARRAA